MDSVVISLSHQGNQESDLALPANVPVAQLLPILVQELQLSDLISVAEADLAGRVTSTGQIIRPEQTLSAAGVVDGDVIEIITKPKRVPFPEQKRSQVTEEVYFYSPTTKTTIPFRGRAALIGRGRLAVINLAALPNSDVVSHRHAHLVHNRTGYWIRDEHSLNGTIIDGQMLEAGERYQLQNGSQVQFGVDGPVLVFYCQN